MSKNRWIPNRATPTPIKVLRLFCIIDPSSLESSPGKNLDIWTAIEQSNNSLLKKILTQVELTRNDLFNSKGDSVLHAAAVAGNTQAIGIILDSNLPSIGPDLSLIHICRCRRYAVCRSRWSPYH
eukprot:TRINITY_DN8052_c0_g1_i1.p2 TRINITY_DN8052_c0_g1~~TRINITY_DN8052_c0_g1_i1.p2  ORF type:complete len:125 (-),score=14.50 TRINITY_DN8052_c0_g1_i1:9-383(-)